MRGVTSLRPYEAADCARVAAFLRQSSADDPLIDGPEDEAFAAFVGQPVNRGGADFVVAEVGESIAGVLLSARHRVADRDAPVRDFRLIVAPARRRRGVGTALYEALVRQDAGAVFRRTVLDAGWTVGRGLLTQLGFARVHRSCALRREGPPPELGGPPQGLRLRDVALPRDLDALRALHDEAFGTAFGFAEIDADDVWGAAEVPGGRFVVAVSGDAVVGCVLVLPHPSGVGVIETLQVGRSWRRRGLGRALTLAGMHALGAQGYRAVTVSVDAENLAAVALYEGLGFEPAGHEDTLELRTA